MLVDKREAIFQILTLIPKGKVATYGQVASSAGLGRAARFVGTTLKQQPEDSKLPWHRVINSKGTLAFPPNHPNLARQKSLLLDEGIEFKGNKVDLKRFLWQP